jgi:hypothetical protein
MASNPYESAQKSEKPNQEDGTPTWFVVVVGLLFSMLIVLWLVFFYFVNPTVPPRN